MTRLQRIYTNLSSIIFVTPLRAAVILITPLLPFCLKCFFYSTTNKQVNLLLYLVLISGLIGLLRGNIDIANLVLYLWICAPIIYLLFCDVKDGKRIISWENLFKNLRLWLIVIDVIGFVCRFIIFKTVDDFGRAYGTHFKGVSGLCAVNAYVMLYYLAYLLKGNKEKKYLYNFLFFFCSFIFCFSGLTVITFVAMIALYFIFNLRPKNLFRIGIIIVIGLSVLVYSAKEVLEYNVRNVELFLDDDAAQSNARKRVMYSNFTKLISSDLSKALVGVGSGGYNSRTCFLINDDSNNIFTTILGHHMPKYHKSDIYPLWNNVLVSYDSYTDGARNKPFSSLVGFGAEIGLVFLFFFSFFWFKKIWQFRRKSRTDVDFLYLYLLNMFVYLLLVTEYWFESSEFILFLVIQNSMIANKLKIETKS